MSLIKFAIILRVVAIVQVLFLLSCVEGGKTKSRRRLLVSDASPYTKAEPDGTPSCTSDYRLDWFVFTLSWAPAHGSSKRNFIIKGLKPKLRKTNKGRCCAKESFDLKALEPLEKELKENWPDDQFFPAPGGQQEPREVWTREWEQSGRCLSKVSGLNSVFKYFSFALKNFNKLALKSAFTSKGFYPTDHQTYYGQNIVTALLKRYGVRADIKCAPLKNNPRKLIITEIEFCYGTDLKEIDCPYSSNDCLGEVAFIRTSLKTAL